MCEIMHENETIELGLMEDELLSSFHPKMVQYVDKWILYRQTERIKEGKNEDKKCIRCGRIFINEGSLNCNKETCLKVNENFKQICISIKEKLKKNRLLKSQKRSDLRSDNKEGVDNTVV
jgi:hypothetical protein